MADPVSIGSMVLGGAGAGVSAFGSLFQGDAQSNMYKYQAGVARVNAAVATQDANYAREAGEVEATNAGMRTRAEVGSTRAGMAAGNVAINSGSGARVVSSSNSMSAGPAGSEGMAAVYSCSPGVEKVAGDDGVDLGGGSALKLAGPSPQPQGPDRGSRVADRHAA